MLPTISITLDIKFGKSESKVCVQGLFDRQGTISVRAIVVWIVRRPNLSTGCCNLPCWADIDGTGCGKDKYNS